MTDHLQMLVALGLVAVAAVYLIRRAVHRVRAFRLQARGGPGSCGGCDGGGKPAGRRVKMVGFRDVPRS